MDPEERSIREVHLTWIDAVNAGDLDRLLAMMADDAVLLSPGNRPIDRDGFCVNYSTARQQLQFHCNSELEEVVVVGKVAYTRSRDALSVSPRGGGDATQFAGHRITIYRKQPRRPLAPCPRCPHVVSNGEVSV